MRNIKTVLLLLLVVYAVTSFSIEIPLTYNRVNGDYYFLVHLPQKENEPINLMLDTGSSNLNVVGDEKLCSSCQLLVKSHRFTVKPPTKKLDGQFSMRYGLGGGLLQRFQSTVKINENLSLDTMDFGVYVKGNDINNIVGFAYPTASAPHENPMPAFFTELNKKYKLNDEFTLLLCGKHGSKLFLGPLPSKMQKVPSHTVPITKQQLYFINFYGISNEKDEMLVNFPQGSETIVDSGTTGKMVFPESSLRLLIDYIKQHTSQKNRDLPEAFWQSQLCLAKESIDLASFPTFYFHFKDTDGKAFRLPLTHLRYLDSNSCGTGMRRFSFIGYKANKTNSRTPSHKKDYPPFVILGTPFLEGYTTTFKQYNPAVLKFYDSDYFCKGSGNSKKNINTPKATS